MLQGEINLHRFCFDVWFYGDVDLEVIQSLSPDILISFATVFWKISIIREQFQNENNEYISYK